MRHTGQGSSINRSLYQLTHKITKYFNTLNHLSNKQHKNKLPINHNPINRVTQFLKYLGHPVFNLLLLFILFSNFTITQTLNLLSLIGRTVLNLPPTILNLFKHLSLPRLPKPSIPKIDLPHLPSLKLRFSQKTHHPIQFSIPQIPHLQPPHFPKLPSPRIKLRPSLLNLSVLMLILISTFLYYWILKDLPSPRKLSNLQPELTTQIFDRHGRLLYKIYDQEKRTLVSLEDIPLHTRQATIAIEDKHFYSHQGLSLKGIIRAIQRNLTTQEIQGGSTITQQLIKNTLLTNEKTLQRKIKEVILAIHTELIFSKDQILQMYFNQVGYGGPAYGIQEAAQQYFAKNVSDLNLAESALLAGLPQSPTRYSPFGAHPELAKQRQIQVLDRMLEDEYITLQQYQDALNTPLTFAPPQTSILAPHFVMYIKDLLVSYFGEELVTHGGLQVHTTLDLDIQNLAQSILNQELDQLKNLHVNNGAVLITNPPSGEILAMVGSRNYFDIAHDGQVNLTTSLRQPGSAIKPINYALAFETGLTPSTIIYDTPVTFNLPGSKPYTPNNYDGRFHGAVTLRTALASSYNVPAVKLLNRNGVIQMARLASQMGITTWDNPARYGLSLTLGSNEVKMTDMAEVYGTFANLGVHVPLNPILSIKDSSGQPLKFNLCNLPQTDTNQSTFTVQAATTNTNCQPHQVISPETAYLISDILSDNQARTPAFGSRSVLHIPDYQVAVKTGTSNDLRDNWTIGYTPELLVATWVGNNDNSPMSRIASGITGASPIWSQITSQILKNTVPTTFPAPSNIVKVPICTLTNTLTCSACPSTRLETFIQGTQPTITCTTEQINQALEKNTSSPLAQSPLDQNNNSTTD